MHDAINECINQLTNGLYNGSWLTTHLFNKHVNSSEPAAFNEIAYLTCETGKSPHCKRDMRIRCKMISYHMCWEQRTLRMNNQISQHKQHAELMNANVEPIIDHNATQRSLARTALPPHTLNVRTKLIRNNLPPDHQSNTGINFRVGFRLGISAWQLLPLQLNIFGLGTLD